MLALLQHKAAFCCTMYFCPTALRLVPHESHMMAYFRRQGRNCRTSMRANTGMEQRKCTSKDR